jgi:hypothetical protein
MLFPSSPSANTSGNLLLFPGCPGMPWDALGHTKALKTIIYPESCVGNMPLFSSLQGSEFRPKALQGTQRILLFSSVVQYFPFLNNT